MADAAPPSADPQPTEQTDGPLFMFLGQFVKDLSFEAPNVPQVFDLLARKQPAVNVGLNVDAAPHGDDIYEITLRVNAEARAEETVAFILELEYAGMVRARLPQEHLEPMLLIEGPRFLFPFARNIICDCTRNGGFTPLLLQPVDFSVLYRQRLEDRQKAAGQTGEAPKIN